MKKYCLLMALMLVTVHSFCQERIFAGRITDKDSHEGIPYCVVKVKDRNEGVYTDENGRFSFTANADSAKVFIIYSLGYKRVELVSNELTRDSILVSMVRESSALKEVVVNANEGKQRSAWLGKKKSKHVSDCYQTYGEEIAVYLNADKGKQAKLNELFIYITSEGVPDSKFRIHIYEKDSVTNMPARELTDSNVIVHADKGDEWVHADLSNRNIWFENGVFIGIEWISGYGNKDGALQSLKHAEVNKLNGQVLGLTKNSWKGKGAVKFVFHRNAFQSEWGTMFTHNFSHLYAPMIYGKYQYYKN